MSIDNDLKTKKVFRRFYYSNKSFFYLLVTQYKGM